MQLRSVQYVVYSIYYATCLHNKKATIAACPAAYLHTHRPLDTPSSADEGTWVVCLRVVRPPSFRSRCFPPRQAWISDSRASHLNRYMRMGGRQLEARRLGETLSRHTRPPTSRRCDKFLGPVLISILDKS